MRRVAKLGGAGALACVIAAATFVACAMGTTTAFPTDEGGIDDAGTKSDRTTLPPPTDSGTTTDTGGPETDSGGGSCTKKVVLNEIQTGTSGNANLEFVELYNPNTCAVPLGNWKIRYQSSAGNDGVAGHSFAVGDSIAAKSFLVVAAAAFTGKKDAVLEATGFAGGDGQIGLLDETDKVVDGVAYGTVTGGKYRETTAAPSPPANGTIGRKADGVDTDNNSADWKTMASGTPGAAN
ncbi:MAG: lamin tail domain-containing protein [Deltaproteobacteria bacterium]|nr:lamin tail domain-containing protein [Deltaproteobacteria bacterium]